MPYGASCGCRPAASLYVDSRCVRSRRCAQLQRTRKTHSPIESAAPRQQRHGRLPEAAPQASMLLRCRA